MPRTSVKERLKQIRANKRKLKAALARLPTAPPVAGLAGRVYNLALSARDPLVDASSIAFSNELQLALAADLLESIERTQRPIPTSEAVRMLLDQGRTATGTGVELLEALSDDDFADTPMIDAIVEDIQTGRDVIRDSRQFSRANIVGGINLENRPGSKRTRKKTKTDKNMSKALRLANERFRKKNGSLRKGATQSKIMKYAHKLLKKM
jgi:hypothetical protein